MFGSGNYLLLQGFTEISEVIAITGHPNNQIPMFLPMHLGNQTAFTWSAGRSTSGDACQQ